MPKGKKGAGDPADGPDVDAGAKAIAEVMSLRTQLGMRQTALTDAETAKRQAEEKLAKLRADFDQEQETAYEISKDMTRQYKGMQEQLVERITQLSNTVQDLQDKLDDAESHLAKVTREKDDIIAAKDEEISAMKAKMEDMAREFGGMLKETLDKMRERIELSSTNLDVDVVPDGAAVEAYGV